jgi:hypothetical protein
MTFVLHTTGPVQIDSTVIGGIRDLGSNMASQVRGEPTSGEIYARLVAIYGQKPVVQFTTEDLQAALTACGPTGVSLATKALTLYGSKILAGGGIDTTGHVSLACALGTLYPKQLSVAHQGDATLSYEAMLYNAVDATDPFTLTSAAVLPTAVDFTKWAMSTCTMGGVSITQQMNIGVDFGVRCFGEGSDSDIRPKITAIESILPTITASSSNNGAIVSLLGAHGAFSIVLRERVAGGTWGTGTITIAATGGLAIQETPFQAAGHRPGEISAMGHIEWDGTNAPLTFTYDDGV